MRRSPATSNGGWATINKLHAAGELYDRGRAECASWITAGANSL